uniref:Small ribosomal subunit protein mS23 conserved domain-containing protein n=1 Tax=Timspurckia oligopyrenoides TaxID=708627 RepID=A0A7S0ZFY6_9RHOD
MVRGPPYRKSFEALVLAGVLSEPTWLRARNMHKPVILRKTQGKLKEIEFPEDRLKQKVFEKYPKASKLPYDLNAQTRVQSHVVEKFIAQQYALMQTKSLSESEAFEQVENELKAELTETKVTLALASLSKASKASSSSTATNEADEDFGLKLYRASVHDAENEMNIKLALDRNQVKSA